MTARFLDHVLPPSVVVMIEDAHWMDEASCVVLDQIVHALALRPALVCSRGARSTPASDCPTPNTRDSLTLAPITAEDAVRAVVAATDDAPLRADEIALLAERAAGNPLFLVELLETLRDGATSTRCPTPCRR